MTVVITVADAQAALVAAAAAAAVVVVVPVMIIVIMTHSTYISLNPHPYPRPYCPSLPLSVFLSLSLSLLLSPSPKSLLSLCLTILHTTHWATSLHSISPMQPKDHLHLYLSHPIPSINLWLQLTRPQRRYRSRIHPKAKRYTRYHCHCQSQKKAAVFGAALKQIWRILIDNRCSQRSFSNTEMRQSCFFVISTIYFPQNKAREEISWLV